jgi:trehalose-6-phosphate synthase
MKLSRYQLRFLVPLLLTLLVASALALHAVSVLTQNWFIKDIQLRSSLLSTALAESISRALDAGTPGALTPIFERTADDERLTALGLCRADGTLLLQTREYPSDLSCLQAEAIATENPPILTHSDPPQHIAIRSVHSATGQNVDLVMLHGMDYVQHRINLSRNYFLAFLILLGTIIAVTTTTTAQLSQNTWVQSVRDILRGEDIRQASNRSKVSDLPPDLANDIRGRLRDLEDEYRRLHQTEDQWTPERLHALLHTQLKGEQIIVISNREPWIHEQFGDEVRAHQPASGLVTAIEPIVCACSGVWIAHGSGSADRQVADAHSHIALPPDHPRYRLRRVWLSDAELTGYYDEMSNRGLWPLAHNVYTQPEFRQQDWALYQQVNQRFALTAIAEARVDDPVILVQDYHLALVPAMIRKQLPKATVITFWHIPWPNPEAFSICPWRREILEGLLGSTILGFQTRQHCRNFIDTVDLSLEARIDQDLSTVLYGDEETRVESYPISIAWPDADSLTKSPPVAVQRQRIRHQYGLHPTTKILLGVDRFDYTKGLYERLEAYEQLLEQHHAKSGNITFIQVAVPTREHIAEYRDFRARIQAKVQHINNRFKNGNHAAIYLVEHFHNHDELNALYRAADVCVVSSLHDGMNLVCKEFIAAREDEQGVLVLSQFAGASRELPEALLVNPYHIEGMTAALLAALTMPAAEQRERMASMRATVRDANVFRWAGRMLIDAGRQRLNQRIARRVSAFHDSAA